MTIDVKPVKGLRDRREFISLPFRLHEGTPWVPPLRIERHLFLSPRMNPYFKHGDAQLFLARRDGRVVGRISAQIDFAYNEQHDTRQGWFGFIEFEDDIEIVQAMLSTAAEWVTDRGMKTLVGPADFSVNDESGIVIEGHEIAPMVREPWHPPYYQPLCEQAGLTKAVDLQMWRIDIDDSETMRPIIRRLSDEAEPKHGVTLRRISRRRLRKDLDLFAEIYNEAWRNNWGFVPYGKADLDAYAFDMQLVYDRRWLMIAERGGEAIGLALSFPDINQALVKMNGRLFPFGIYHYLRRNKYIDQVRIGFLGVKREHQHTGASARLYVEHFDTSRQHKRIKSGEGGWVLETNTAMNKGMEAMGARVVKKYRMYEYPVQS
jgi:hypothetical protein